MESGHRSEESFTVEFGQYEPLTRRLHNLLKEYKDGFSVPKELIQNAEDAGATEVCFLYDERQNLDATTGLISDRLDQFQGPALWAYNNEKFTKEDFCNIRKLGGATKEEDTTKVGKFGLGFNSVYNLTDLPSFISGNQAVIFDPHSTYLGKLGLSTDLKRERDSGVIFKWRNQLKPYDGVFGCRLNSPGPICNGTLFRFPLRTKQQAQTSEIKDLSYSHKQMREFFTVFAKYAGSLLLFTQNVQSVSFYFLPESGKPEQVVKLVDVRKTIIYKHLVYHDVEEDASNMNVLEYSSEALRREFEGIYDELQFIEEQNKIEVTFAKHSFNRACKVDPTTNQTTWQIAWSVGNTDARVFATSSHLKGLVPLAAVAIPLKTLHTNSESLCSVSDCGRGFYQKGHLFCFMPLPITTSHKIHINATFAVTSDRRQLCVQSTDDTDSAEADWNKVLETHVIGDAWAYALQSLSQFGYIDESVYYDLWPLGMESFYTTIVEKNLKVFCRESGRKWSSYDEMLVLEPHLRNDPTVGTIAFSVLKKYLDGVKGWVIDLPTLVLDHFRTCGLQQEIDRRTISEERFFKIFFSKISDSFLSVDERNKLTSHALLSSSQSLRQMVKVNRCIPTKPNGKLRMPSELVSPKGQAAKLYLEHEEVFPNGSLFSGHSKLKTLASLGMTADELSSEKIAERAHLIQKSKSVHLAKNLLKYLNRDSTDYPNDRRLESCYDVQRSLQSMKILPVLEKPMDWPVDWEGDSKSFTSPSDLYQTDLANLVGCCENILDSNILEISPSGLDVLKWLGVKSRNDVQISSVLEQLQCLHAENLHSSKKALRKLSDVCHTVYRYLEDYCIHVKQRPGQTNRISHVQDTLKSRPVILSGNRLTEPQKMVFNLLLPLKPYLYEVDEELSQLYPHFLKAIGVRDHFGSSDIHDVMKSIILGAHGPLRGEMLNCFCKAVQVLVDAVKKDGSSVPEVLLPNIDGHLHKASQLCLNDCGWISDQRHMLFLHPNITPKDGQALGVRTKREASLASHITAIPQARGFGQHEPLTSRLKRILDGYPKDVAILKELLQNADDAGATELMFIKDFRCHPTKRVFGDEWKQLQGPALCVFNNSHFTEEDFIGIQSLGEGSKGHDPLKTGQYGVGFNVVYHLTDVPSFMTVGPGIETTLCVLDPHQCYTPRTEEGTPGVQFKDLHVLRQTYKDVFTCYFEDSVMNTREGTLFRFPLRTDDMADISKISRHTTTASELEEMLETFKDEAWSSILFLTSVKKITIASVKSNGKLSVDYIVEASLPDADQIKVQTYLSTLKSLLPQHDLINMAPFQIQIIKTLMDSKNGAQNWLIVHQVGFDRSLPIPEDIKFYWRRKEIQLLPRGGVAVPLNRNQHFSGILFCVLPLPKQTGLPVHINGHFSLGHEARRDLWQGTNDYRVQWNEHVTKAIICPTYIAAVQQVQTLCFPDVGTQSQFDIQVTNYYKLFPRFEKTTDSYVKLLVKAFYTAIAENHISMFPVLKPHTGVFLKQPGDRKLRIEWAPVAAESGFPGYFNTTGLFIKEQLSSYPHFTGMKGTRVEAVQSQESPVQKDKRILTWVLKDLGMKIIESSPDIQRQFEKTDFKDQVKGTSPQVVSSFLKSSQNTDTDGCHVGDLPKPVNQTPIQSVENVKLLTKFCKMQDTYENTILNLPLMVTQSHVLSRFSKSNEYLVTEYNDLIPNSADKVLHESLVPMYTQLNLPLTGCLKRMDIASFTQLLDENLDTAILKTGKPTLWHGIPSKLWICHLWQFLSSEVNDQIKKLRSEKKKEREEDTALTHLSLLREWSLIPAFLTQPEHGSQTDLVYLYPVKYSRHVIGLHNSSNESFQKVLVKVCLPRLLSSTFSFDKYSNFLDGLHLCNLIVANMGDPESMLDALSKTSGSASKLSVTECCTVLQYFDGNMTILHKNVPNLLPKLKNLSYFPSLSGMPTSVNQYSQVQVVTDSFPYTPEAGLEDLFISLGRTLIIHKHYYENILKYLELQHWSREKAYTEVIIPNLMSFNPGARMKHLLHIRDQIVPNPFFLNDERQDLLDRLKRIPFVITRDGQKHIASDFYSKKIAEFQAMCPPDAFLPSPFDEDDWQYCLELLGLKCQVSVDDFVQFAKKLERESQRGITQQVATKSQLLVEHLQWRPNLTQEGLLRNISNIRFVLPCDIEKETDDGSDLRVIHSQYENALKLVSYSGSCDPHFYRDMWTSCTMWKKEADICKYLRQKDAARARSQLDMTEEPTVDVLVRHLQNISSTLDKKDIAFKKQRSSLLEMIFSGIYGHLKEHKQNVTMTSRLLSFPTVYLVDECEVVHASDVVIELQESETIPGYIFKAPVFFGNFFGLFVALGAQKCASANTYALVLQKLFIKTRGNQLHPNELKIVGHSFFNLIKCQLEKEKANIQTDALYLPNTECILADSASLVHNDNENFAKRVTDLELTFFIGFDAMKLNIYNMPYLPEKYRMVPLSEIVHETLTSACLLNVSHSGSANNYEQKIKSSQFVKGILRICNHQSNYQSEEFTSAEATGIEKKLTSIKIRQVEGLETILEYRGERVSGSEQKKECYVSKCTANLPQTEEDNDEIVTVYLSAFRTKESIILFKIASAIDTLTHDRLGRYTSVVEKMLVSEPETISGMLDECGVKKYTHKNIQHSTVYPRVGTLIPDKFHWMLDNSFTMFCEGEYVGLDVYDPFLDNSEARGGDNSLPVYVYAIVVKVEDDSSPMTATYLVEVEEEVTKSVSATMLYKFHREKENTTTDLVASYGSLSLDSSAAGNIHNILKDIRQQLQRAWDMLKPSERNRVRLRLLSHWHPDRNPNNVQLCTAVCQHIGLYIQRLEKGESLDTEDVHQATFDSSFYDEVTRRTNLQTRFRHSGGSRSSASCHRETRSQAYPHLGEAQRWLRQAKSDLEAAREALSTATSGHHNWTCYKSHQAGEKALKAVLFTVDSVRADELKVHVLPQIAEGLDTGLKALARKLHDQVKNNNVNGLRYPDRSAYPRIPAEEYSSSNAKIFFQLAEMIVNIASQKVC